MELKLKEVKEIPKELKITLTPEETKKLNSLICGYYIHDEDEFLEYQLCLNIKNKEATEIWKELIYEIYHKTRSSDFKGPSDGHFTLENFWAEKESK